MNRDDITRMAKEAGGDDWGIFRDFMPELERFAALVAAAELRRLHELSEAVANLIKVKGRHNTEIAYQRLVAAYDKAQGDNNG